MVSPDYRVSSGLASRLFVGARCTHGVQSLYIVHEVVNCRDCESRESLRTANELERLLAEVGDIDRQLDAVSRPLIARRDEIKGRIRQLYAENSELFESRTGKTVGATHGSVTVTVTQPDTPVKVDYPGLISRIGAETFCRVWSVTAADMDTKEWAAVVAEEKASENDLADFLSEGKKPTPRVSFGKTRE